MRPNHNTGRDHECPAPGCTARVPHTQLACRPHWYAIPRDLRDDVWRAFRQHGQGSIEHGEAIATAIGWLERKAAGAAE